MANIEREQALPEEFDEGAGLVRDEGRAEADDLPQEREPPPEIIFRTPFPRPRVGALRNIVATVAVGLAILALIWFFDRSPGFGQSQSITLTASPNGPAPRIGKEAPEFTVRELNGGDFRLSDYRGQPVWINFWATWCPPCRAETPDIQEVYEEYRDEGLVVIAISIGEDAGTVRGYEERTKTTFTIGVDGDTSVAAQYRIVGIPTHFFIDSDGVLREWRIGSMSKGTMESKVESIVSPANEESEQ